MGCTAIYRSSRYVFEGAWESKVRFILSPMSLSFLLKDDYSLDYIITIFEVLEKVKTFQLSNILVRWQRPEVSRGTRYHVKDSQEDIVDMG